MEGLELETLIVPRYVHCMGPSWSKEIAQIDVDVQQSRFQEQ